MSILEGIPVRAAGGVLVKKDAGEWKVLLIQKRQSRLWMLPKGHLKEGETSAEASQREVAEETGFAVTLGPLIGAISFSYTRNLQRFHETVDFYLMTTEYARDWWDEDEILQSKWFSFEEAQNTLAFPDESGILREGRQLLEGL
ncbi:MAG TPA: NUDIX hydrolase [Atribacteraceae bacterium]|nr:NUDIX hydrolase [Atribacteraceae bacterium]